MATTVSSNVSLNNLTQLRRTWRTQIESQRKQPVTIIAHREEILEAADGTLIHQNQNAGVINRPLTKVASETVTLPDGTVISALQTALAVEAFLERWDSEDRAPKVAPTPAPAPVQAPAPLNEDEEAAA